MITTNDQNPLIDLLGDADPDVRLRAAVDLGTAREVDAAGALVARLGVEPSHAIRETLSWAVLRLPEASRPWLDEALRGGWQARMQALHVLSKLGDPSDAGRIGPLVADPVDAVASRAWWAAGQGGNSALAAPLVGQLGRGDAELRNSLSIALEELCAAAITPLTEALLAGSEGVREHAADTLGLIGSPVADPAALALADLVDEGTPVVGFAALNALGHLDVPLRAAAVESALAHPDPRVAALARRLAARPGPRMSRRPAVVRPAASGPGTGLVAAHGHALISLRCASDPVSMSPRVRRLAQRIVAVAAGLAVPTRERLLGADLGGRLVADALAELSIAAGEPIELGDVVALPGAHSYVAADRPSLPARVGALVVTTGVDDPPLVVKVLRQIAWCGPDYVSRTDVPESVWADVRAAARRQVGERPADLAERFVAGRLADWATRHVLLDQVCLADPGVTIDGLLYGRGVRITAMARLAVPPADAPAR